MVALGVDATTAVATDGAVVHVHCPVVGVKDTAAATAGRVAVDNAVAHAHRCEAGAAVVVDATTTISG